MEVDLFVRRSGMGLHASERSEVRHGSMCITDWVCVMSNFAPAAGEDAVDFENLVEHQITPPGTI